MARPHKCPVCDGTGKVSRPPHIAGDIPSWTDSGGGPYMCNGCKGSGVVWEIEFNFTTTINLKDGASDA